MIVTEAEAKRKWCSHALVPVPTAGDNVIVANRRVGTVDGGDGTKLSDSRCFASNCMHWSWVHGDYASDADRLGECERG